MTDDRTHAGTAAARQGGRPRAHCADLDRPLTARGHADAGAAGAWLADAGTASGAGASARRPAAPGRPGTGWRRAGRADPSGGAPEVHYEQRLYDGGRTELCRPASRPSPDDLHHGAGDRPQPDRVRRFRRCCDPTTPTADDGLRTAGIAVHGSPAPGRLRAGHGTPARDRTPPAPEPTAAGSATRRRPASIARRPSSSWGSLGSERLLGQVHHVERGALDDPAVGAEAGQHLAGEEPGRGDLALVERLVAPGTARRRAPAARPRPAAAAASRRPRRRGPAAPAGEVRPTLYSSRARRPAPR